MTDTQAPQGSNKPAMTGKQAYNLVTDTVTGVNVRGKDNLFQLVVIVVCLILGVGLGYFDGGRERTTIMALGALGGLSVGLIVSGVVLMIYRGVRHARGKHD